MKKVILFVGILVVIVSIIFLYIEVYSSPQFRTFTKYETGETIQVDSKSISSIVPIVGDEKFGDRTLITIKDAGTLILVEGIVEN